MHIVRLDKLFGLATDAAESGQGLRRRIGEDELRDDVLGEAWDMYGWYESQPRGFGKQNARPAPHIIEQLEQAHGTA